MPKLRRTTAVPGVIACLAAAGALAAATSSAPAGAAAAPVAFKIPQADCCFTSTLRPGQQIEVTGDVGQRTIVAGTLPPGPGSSYGQTSTGYRLVLETSGTLAEHRQFPDGSDGVVWSVGHGATRLVFQTDHNVVLRNAAGAALWTSGTAGSAATYFGPYGNGQIVTQDASGRIVSAAGPSVTSAPGVNFYTAESPNRQYALLAQADGNLVEYDRTDPAHPRAVWASGTSRRGQLQFTVQQDGNLVLRRLVDGALVWQSGAHGPTAYYQLDVQNDRNVVVYRTDGVHRVQAVWATGTTR